MKKVKVGIVGVGVMGMMHAETLLTKIPQAEVIAVCDIEEKVKMMQEKWDVPYGYTNYDDMVNNEEVEAIVIASATMFHCEHAMKAIKAGKHVFTEKPIGMNDEECKQLVEAVENYDKQFMVAFMRRYEPSYAQAKAMIDAGEIGEPILYRGYSLDPVWVAEYLAQRAELNGLWFLDMGVHEWDLSRWFLGSDPETVYAAGGAYSYPVFDKTNDVDNGYALIKFKNKACAFIYVGKTAPHGTHVETEIVGTKGTIRLCDDARNSHIKLYRDGGVKTFCYKDYLERWEKAYYMELVEFIDNIIEGKPAQSTAKDGYMANTIGLTVQKAYETGELQHFKFD